MQAKLFRPSFLPSDWRGPKIMKDYEKVIQAAVNNTLFSCICFFI